jgi:TPR repeat protein
MNRIKQIKQIATSSLFGLENWRFRHDIDNSRGVTHRLLTGGAVKLSHGGMVVGCCPVWVCESVSRFFGFFGFCALQKKLVMHTRRGWLLALCFLGAVSGFAAENAGTLRARATKGDVGAQIALAHVYRCGGILPRDPRAAYSWAKQAAAAGNPVGAMVKGLALRDGDGVLVDEAAAAEAFREAWEKGLEDKAQAGDVLAAAYCGVAYLEGAGVAPSTTKALEYLGPSSKDVAMAKRELAFLLLTDRKRRFSLEDAAELIEEAAEDGDAQALYLASGFYRKGNGVRKDEKRADKLLLESARQGSVSGQAGMARRALAGEPSQEAYREAASWYKRAAEQGDAESQEALAWLLFDGSAGERNLMDAAGWFGAAARGGRLSAQVQFARVLFEGLGRPNNVAEAARWYRRAADAGNAEAQFMMAWMHFNGRGLSRNEIQARGWLAKAADSGHLLACFSYATMLESGRAGKSDAAAARVHYEVAAVGGFPQAQFNLGMMIAEGVAGKADPVLAAAWLTLAAESGIVAARERIKDLDVKEEALGAAVEALRAKATGAVGLGSLLPAEAQTFAGYGRAASGWITDRGLVVTSSDLVGDAGTVRVHLSANDVRLATVVMLDKVNGLAVLRVAGERPKSGLTLRVTPVGRKQEKLVIAGYGRPNQIALGPELRPSGALRDNTDVRMLELTAGYAATLVGGVVVDLRGEVVGALLPVPGGQESGRAVRAAYVGALLKMSDDEVRRRPGRMMEPAELAEWIAEAVVLVTVD